MTTIDDLIRRRLLELVDAAHTAAVNEKLEFVKAAQAGPGLPPAEADALQRKLQEISGWRFRAFARLRQAVAELRFDEEPSSVPD